MKLTILGSSSSGNCYLFTSLLGETLICECGVKMSEVKQALDFDLSKVSGCISTHGHGDHFKYAKDMLSAGIDVYASRETFDTISIVSHRIHAIKAGGKFEVGSFTILPFETKHDCPGSLGFLIKHEECGVTLFLTDSFYSEFKFKGLNQILCECNYSEEILHKNVFSGKVHPSVAKRVTESHMSLETTIELLKANDLRQVNNIVLLHLSSDNSDAVRFQKEIFELTRKNVVVADKGITVELNKMPF